jgi:hypothetical protein
MAATGYRLISVSAAKKIDGKKIGRGRVARWVLLSNQQSEFG